MLFKFGGFELDTDKRELRRDACVRAVEPQVFNLLAFLISHRDRIVTRDELLDAVWRKRIVSESVMASRINAARRAVDDDGKHQRVIRTLRKSGIRFIADVVEERSQAARPSSAPRLNRAIFDLSGAPSVALRALACVDASGTSRSAIAALEDEIRLAFHSVDWLRVASSGSSEFNAKEGSHRACFSLEGSLRTEPQRRVIIVRLTDARSGLCVWSEKYQSDWPDSLSSLSLTAARIVQAVAEQVFAIERVRARAVRADARSVWDTVVASLSMINTRKRDRVRDAEALLAKVLQSGITSSTVFSLLSFCGSLSVHLGWQSRHERRAIAYNYVERAFSADEGDPWAHLALGYAQLYMDNNPADAIASLRHALNLDPRLSIAHYLIALCSVYLGETEVAFKEASIAENLSSLDLLAKGNVGAHDNVRATTCFVAGRYEEGVQFARRAISLSPLQVPAFRQLVLNAAFAGDIKLAAAAVGKVRSSAPNIQRWLAESEPLWARSEDYKKYIEAFRMAGVRQS